MRVLRNAAGGVASDMHMDQHRLAAHVEELWNEWEIQALVLVSFGLQVFLFLFSGIRKRTTSNVLCILLWLAYLSADSLAVFVLGHLTLHIYGGLRHGLVLFWALFMLLHLGGQETMTAFSMEDNMLWKRHLLSFATQVGLAAYVVGKQWQGDNKQLLAPMVLMFISGTIKYAGRISALKLAAEQTSRRSRITMKKHCWTCSNLSWVRDQELKNYKQLVLEANKSMLETMAFLMDMPLFPYRLHTYHFLVNQLLPMEHRVYVCYKQTELQLSILYDYFYTKLGAHFVVKERLTGWFLRLVRLGSTFAALFLFAWADVKGNLFSYNRADIIVSYILLGGAIILETISIFIVISSFKQYFWAVTYKNRCQDVIFSIVRRVHPESKPQWSQKLPQYNLISRYIQEKRAAAGCGDLLQRIMRAIGVKPSNITYIDVSHELKKLLLDKLLLIGSRPNSDDDWDMGKFTGRWAKLELQSKMQSESSSSSAASHLQFLLSNSTEHAANFMSSVLTWHIATEICFFREDETGSSSSSASYKGPSRELSNCVMHLSAKYIMYSGSEVGDVILHNAQYFIYNSVKYCQEALDESAFVRHIAAKRHDLTSMSDKHIAFEPVLILAVQLSEELIKINDRWDIIMNVWMEMLCYTALHCRPGFHLEHLSKGGEFISHVRLLMLNLGLPYSVGLE